MDGMIPCMRAKRETGKNIQVSYYYNINITCCDFLRPQEETSRSAIRSDKAILMLRGLRVLNCGQLGGSQNAEGL